MGPIERKGSENLAKSGATVVDQSNLGQPPRALLPSSIPHAGFFQQPARDKIPVPVGLRLGFLLVSPPPTPAMTDPYAIAGDEAASSTLW